MPTASRGEVWRVDFEPVGGHEQGRVRRALIVSSDIYNHGPAGLVTVVPMTTKGRPIRSFLRVDPPEAGLPKTSFLICEQVRTISGDRLGRRFGAVSAATMTEVEMRLKFLLDLR
jgi:mRNA interferase MazF